MRKAMNRHHSAKRIENESPGCTILKDLGGKAFPNTIPDEAVTRAKSFGLGGFQRPKL